MISETWPQLEKHNNYASIRYSLCGADAQKAVVFGMFLEIRGESKTVSFPVQTMKDHT
jgi:hypothetical protein